MAKDLEIHLRDKLLPKPPADHQYSFGGITTEDVTEILDIEIFSKLNTVAKNGAILATNTSGLDINEIAYNR